MTVLTIMPAPIDRTNQRHIERIFHKADQRHAKFSRIAMPVKILQSTFLD